MLGNFLRECGVTERLVHASQNEIINVLTIFLGFYPKPVLNVVNPAVEKTMSWVGASDPAPAMTPAEGGEAK